MKGYKANTIGFILMIGALVSACSETSSTGIPYGADELTIDTELSQGAVALGESVTAMCVVTHKTLGVVDVPTSVLTNPIEGIRVQGMIVTPESSGLYNVGCVVSELPQVYDTTPVTLIATTSGAASVDTIVDPELSAPGAKAEVRCIGLNWSGEEVTAETTFSVSTPDNVTVDGNTISSTVTGVYEVMCALVDLPSVVDLKPAIWEVASGDPVSVSAKLSSDAIPSGEKAIVTCEAVDANGNIVVGLSFTLESDPSEGVTIDGMEVVGGEAGEYKIFCVLAGEGKIESIPGILQITAGIPVEIEIFVTPEAPGYGLGAEVTLSWIVRDSQGNEVAEPSVTLAAPNSGVTFVSGTTYTLDVEGEHSFTAIVDNAPSETSATRVLYVDLGAPTLVITYPTRGLTLTDDPFVQVEGTILDPISGVAELTINGSKVSVGEDGAFSFSVQSGHGLNVVDVQGNDAAGNYTSQAIGYYYSTEYQNYEETTLENVMLQEAMKVFLGKDVIDDGVHDKTNIDDLATLIEVVLTQADLNALLAGTIEPILIPGVVDEPATSPGGVSLQGDLVIYATFSNTTVSDDMNISLTPMEGGIQAEGEIPLSSNGDSGLIMEVSLNVALELAASTVIDLDGLSIPAQATLTPTFTTITYASVDTVDFSTSYMISKSETGPLSVVGKNFSISMGEIDIQPIQDSVIDLGTVEFELLGFPLPFTFPLGIVPLDSLFDPIGDLMGGILTPISNFISEELGFIFEPILEDVAAETLKAAILSLELNETLEIPYLAGEEVGTVDVMGELSTVVFTPEGGTIGLKAGAWSEKVTQYSPLGSIFRDSCSGTDMGSFAFSEDAAMAIALNMDFVNEFLFSAWWNGVFDIVMDDATVATMAPELEAFGIKGLRISPMLPPILSDCNSKGLLHIQLGDAAMELDLDGGLVSEPTTMELFTSLDADIYVITNSDSLSVAINGFSQFHVDIVEAGPEWGNLEAELEVAMESLMASQMEKLLGDALGDFPVPSIDLTEALPGVPPGTALEVGNTETALTNGFLLVEGDLE